MAISDEAVEAAIKAFDLKWDELHNHLGGWALGGSPEERQSMRAAIDAAVEAEREACAKIADAESAQAAEQMAENNAYARRTGIWVSSTANELCRQTTATAATIASAIRSRKSGAGE